MYTFQLKSHCKNKPESSVQTEFRGRREEAKKDPSTPATDTDPPAPQRDRKKRYKAKPMAKQQRREK
jgi:hypothetical protein